jgi:hypothetical protein
MDYASIVTDPHDQIDSHTFNNYVGGCICWVKAWFTHAVQPTETVEISASM